MFIEKLKERYVLASYHSRSIVRMVTHRGIEREDVEKTLNIIEGLVKELKMKI